VRHRFAPIGQSEAGIGRFRVLEALHRLCIFKIVKQLHAAQERCLRRRIAAIREVDLAELLARLHRHLGTIRHLRDSSCRQRKRQGAQEPCNSLHAAPPCRGAA
jgi:hypothetical protein